MRSNDIDIAIVEHHETGFRLPLIRLRLLILLTLLLAGNMPPVDAQDNRKPAPSQSSSSAPPAASQSNKQEGISVEFSVEPLGPRKSNATGLLSGTEATLRFKIVDDNGGKPITNLRPAAWIAQRDAGHRTDTGECREKIQSFLQQSNVGKRPGIDLNTYFILALNHEPNISVIDSRSGFGGSKLYNLVALSSSGEDWVLSANKQRLYVSMPLANRVAVIDTVTWKLITNIDCGVRPTRIALQHDGKYLWVGNDSAEEMSSGITVIDTASLKVAAQLKTGAGHHEIAFAADDSSAFITNKQAGTLSVIDVRTLARITDIQVGGLPVAVAFSPLSKAVYVTNEDEGAIVVVDGQRREIIARIKAEPGLRTLRLVPDGRLGFAVNPLTNRVYIFDVSSSRLIHVVPVGPAADQITFTREFAYIRSTASEFVTMIKMAGIESEAEVAVTRFQAGQKAPKESPATTYADAIVPAREGGGVLVANPADKMIHYYTEGMAATMGNFQNYEHQPKALLLLDNSLNETARGVYTTTLRLPRPGHYDVAFLLDSPRLVHCFGMDLNENPDSPKATAVDLKIEPQSAAATPRVGERYNLRFKVIDAGSNLPKADLKDMGVLVFLAPGVWQQREWARALGDGVYEVSFVPPRAGVYYVHFHCPSLKVELSQITPLTLQAVER